MLPGKCCTIWNIVTIFLLFIFQLLLQAIAEPVTFCRNFLQFLVDLNHADI